MRKIKTIVPIVIIILLVGGGALGLYLAKHQKNSTTGDVQSTESAVNLDPPTDEDKADVDRNKQAIIDREAQEKNQPSTPPDTKKSVKPTITYAGQYGANIEVGAYVNGVFEDGGTCTATFTNGSKTLTKSVSGAKNVSSTDCPVMSISKTELGQTGTWKVVVAYSSTSASGTSDQQTIEVK